MRLYGKRSTEEKITKEIVRLLLGQDEILSVQDVAIRLGFSRDHIYNYIQKAVRTGLLVYGPTGRLAIPANLGPELGFRRFSKLHPITDDPLVAEWKQDLLTRKQGEALATWKTRIRSLESVCNNCQINPKDLLVSQKTTEKILRNYAQMYLEGRIKRRFNGKKLSEDIKNVIYCKAQGVRDFCGYYDIIWKRGVGGVMSQAVPNHGMYADVRLTNLELEEADRFIKEKWGLDSNVYRWFWIGIESCCRFEALYSMKLDYVKFTGKTGKIVYIMTAYESKTKQIKKGKWIKYITRHDTQKSIDLLRSRNGTRIYEPRIAKSKFRKEINESLKEVYKHLGKDGYFETHPTHVLRHIGAHYWLAKKNYSYGPVAVIGGWHTIDELQKSYGEMPPEKVLEDMDDED
jgi:predicted DNA-binding protein YlxM (UPF0122 family)